MTLDYVRMTFRTTLGWCITNGLLKRDGTNQDHPTARLDTTMDLSARTVLTTHCVRDREFVIFVFSLFISMKFTKTCPI